MTAIIRPVFGQRHAFGQRPASGPAAIPDAVPAAGEPGAGNVADGHPVAGNTAAGFPASGFPASGNPVAGNPVAGPRAPAAGNPTAGFLAAGNPIADFPTAGSPGADYPGAGDRAARHPAAGTYAAGTLGIGQPGASPGPTTAAATAGPVAAPAGAPPQAIAELRELCLARLDPAAVATQPPDRLNAEIEHLISEIATNRRLELNGREQHDIATELVHDMLGLGPLEPLLEDDSITDIMVNGPDRVFIERAGKVTPSGVHFRDRMHLAGICQRIATAIGRRVDESSPMVDARLKDGSRVNIVFMPLALDGPYVSIRKFSKRAIDFAKLVELGAMTAPVARILQIAAHARLNVIISGGTGSGKTTLLNAMSRLIDPGERIVTVEDAAELQLQQPHVVRLETRPPSLEGKGEVTQRDLVRNAPRMRPDRIIIGEVRGTEAFDMLQAMNTGHDGSMSTIHANTTRDALTRVENMVQMGNMGLPSAAIRTQIVGAVDLIVQVERHRDGGRRVTQVTEVCGIEADIITLNDVFRWEVQHEVLGGRLQGAYRVGGARPACERRLAYFGLEQEWMAVLQDAGA